MSSDSNTAPPPKRRRLRFGMRAFLLAVTAFSLWLGWHVYCSRQQEQAVSAFREYGGWVRYDFQFDDNGKYDPKGESWVPVAIRERVGNDFFHSVVELNCTGYVDEFGQSKHNSNVSPAPLELLAYLPKVRGLFLQDGQVNDDNLWHVAQLGRLERLFIWDGHDVTDAGVAHLRNTTSLTYIHLSPSQMTDRSLAVFGGLPDLEGLSLQFNQLTDDGVRSLAGLKRLEELWICGTEDRPNDITDASLAFLIDLPSFKELGVQSTSVSDDFEARLRERFPKCQVTR